MRIKNQRSTLNVSSDYPIPAINQISNYSYNQTYTKVSKNATSTAYNNEYTVKNITYTITVYDVNGKLHTTSTNHTTEYTV